MVFSLILDDLFAVS